MLLKNHRSIPVIPGAKTTPCIQLNWYLYYILLLISLVLQLAAFSQQLVIHPRSILVVKGNAHLVFNNAAFSNNGQFHAGKGTVHFVGNGDTSLTYIAGDSTSYYNNLFLTSAGEGLTLRSPVTIADSVLIRSGNLFSAGNLTFKSGASKTALLAALPVNGSGNAIAAIKGNITIERYIPGRKAWRLLSAPVHSGNSPTINASWQEGATTASPVSNVSPGFGVHITGGTIANGFDQSPTNNASIKIYNNASNSWVGLPGTPGTYTPVSSYPGYFLYIRGNRGTNLSQGMNAVVSNTTLRVKGELKSGDQAILVNAMNFTVAGNPYPAPIDFHSTSKVNVRDQLYIWDPKMAGIYGLGAYVTLSWNIATGSYDATSAVSAVSQYISSGEAFIVSSEDNINPGTLIIKESDKQAAGSDHVFGFTSFIGRRARIDLLQVNTDNTVSLMDGVLCTYDDDNLNAIDAEDARKLTNSSENIAIRRNNTLLSIERRKTFAETDTISLSISQVRLGRYQLKFDISNMAASGFNAILKDNHSSDNNNKQLDPAGLTAVNFTVNNEPGSYATDRFSIVFSMPKPVPVTFNSVKGFSVPGGISVLWLTGQEINIQKYDVERSGGGSHFSVIDSSIASGNNGGSATYQILDEDPFTGDNFYRVHSIGKDGSTGYSEVVKINRPGVPGRAIRIFPNPVKVQLMHLKFERPLPGLYILRLININGQLVFTKEVNLQAADTRSISLTGIPGGLYQLEISKPGNEKETQKIIIQ